MGLLPPSLPGSQFPGDDALVRKIQDLTRAVNESNNKDPFAGTALVVTSNSLTVNGASTVNTGPFKVNGDSSISGKLDVGGAATFYVGTAFNGATGLYGPVTVTGGLTCNCDATFTGYTTMSGARFNGATTFIGDASFSGYTTIAGARFTGGLTFDNAPTFPGATFVAGATATFSGGATFNGGATISSLAVGGSSTFTGAATFNGSSTFASSPSFSALVNMPGGATVGGTLTSGTTKVNGSLTQTSGFSLGNSSVGSIQTGDFATGDLSITGPSSAGISLNSTTHVYGNFTVIGSKAFAMPHPEHPDTMTLMHAATESDRNGVEYWGTATVGDDGTVTVTLPGYFEALTKTEGRNIQLTAIGRATQQVSADRIVDGAFTIYGAPGQEVDWLVKAERHQIVDGVDKLAFEAEQNQPLGAR